MTDEELRELLPWPSAERMLTPATWTVGGTGSRRARATPEELAELDAAARDEPMLAMAQELFRPLDAAFESQVVERVEAARSAETAQTWWERLRSWRPGPMVLLPAAVLLAVALWALIPAADMPRYSATLAPGDQTARAGTSVPTARFAPGSTIGVTLLPERETADPPAIDVFLDTWTDASRLGVQPEVSRRGAIRIRGTIGHSPWTIEPGPTSC